MNRQSGVALITVICVAALVLSFLIYAGRLFVSDLRMVKLMTDEAKVYYLAEAGLQKAKWKLDHEPSWQPTDPKYTGPSSGLKAWLIKPKTVGGTEGLVETLGEGGYKIIRPQAGAAIYSVGYLGPDPSVGRALCVLKLEASKLEQM
jgi:hypothetical protein